MEPTNNTLTGSSTEEDCNENPTLKSNDERAADGNSGVKVKPPTASTKQPYAIIPIPDGVRGGDKFTATVLGKQLIITCPPNARPGGKVRITIPTNWLPMSDNNMNGSVQFDEAGSSYTTKNLTSPKYSDGTSENLAAALDEECPTAARLEQTSRTTTNEWQETEDINQDKSVTTDFGSETIADEIVKDDPMDNEDSGNSFYSALWSRMVLKIHAPITKLLVTVSRFSATYPATTFYFSIFLSVAILVIGLFTNFKIQVDGIWTPMGSRSAAHSEYIENVGFPYQPRPFFMVFYKDGENVLGEASARLVFEAVDAIRGLEKYSEICDEDEFGACAIMGITRFWNDSASIFSSEVTSDEDAIAAMSSTTYRDGTMAPDDIFGTPIRNADGMLTSTLAYYVTILLPDLEETKDFESSALDVILEMRDDWEENPEINLKIELLSERSFDDELLRAIETDIVLLPIVFLVMISFTSLVFLRNDKVQSRTLLGLNAVVSVLLSIMSGYGFMFICGVPFTSMTQMLPFVLFGIGLDDAFIMTGSYARTDPKKDVVDRIQETIEDIGISITLTTTTSVLAFGLGCYSSVPAVYWLCLYAFPTIAFVFLYQITFYVAAIALDERRIQQNRRDCCVCIVVSDKEETRYETTDDETRKSTVDSFMAWYAKQLMKPVVKFAVIFGFAGLAAFSAYSVTKLEQKFDFTDVLPSDSYATEYLEKAEEYSSRTSPFEAGVYFRYVDQSKPDIQDQMESFVDKLPTIDAISEGPANFWLRSFREFVNGTSGIAEQPFTAQLQAFLADDIYFTLYANDIVLDKNTGEIIVSRCWIKLDQVDLNSVSDQISALEDQRAIAASQPINKARDDWAFFTFEKAYNTWQNYANNVGELILTTIMGVIAVTVVTLIFVPHWTAALFVLPLICVLYIDLLGFMQWFGISVDAVLYVTLVMSIGLLVDFIMHTLLRFYEASGNRKEKTEEMLTTMGSSILIGATSTFLGTMPLAFSTSALFFNIFIAFFGLVVLGAGHGLILLPVILFMIGPEDSPCKKNNR